MRIDEYITLKKLVASRSQAQDLIKRGKVRIGTKIITKPAWKVHGFERVQILEKQQYASRAGQKLASVSEELKLGFNGKVVLDVGSSTGGFTDYALKNKAKLVVAVDVGTDQLVPTLRHNKKVMVFEKTDIRNFVWPEDTPLPDIIVGDVSFISLTKILPSLEKFCSPKTVLAMMAKPQFEARVEKEVTQEDTGYKASRKQSQGAVERPQEKTYKLNNGVVRNNKERREILARFESWLKDNDWLIRGKRDSDVAGANGNVERFYLLLNYKK